MYKMLIAALFTIGRTWKPPKCPSINEWIKKIWYIHTMEYFSTIKQKESLLFATTWMELQGIMLNEKNQAEKRQILYDFIYMQNQKKKGLMDIENRLGVARGRGQGAVEMCEGV